MKLRNKILAFAAPTAAIATVMPIALTSCSETIEMPVKYYGTAEAGSIHTWTTYGTYDVKSGTKYIYSGVTAKAANPNRFSVLTTAGDKFVAVKSIKLNGKSYKVETKVVSSETTYYCDITDSIALGAAVSVEIVYSETVKECVTMLALGIIS